MLDFNLIPPEEKKKLETTKNVLLIGGILKFIALLLIGFCIVLFFTNFSIFGINFSLQKLINSQKTDLEETKKDPIMKQVLSLDESIKSANATIGRVYSVQKNFIYFSPIVERIVEIIPSQGVYITELSIEKKTITPAAQPTATATSTTTPTSTGTTTETVQPAQSFWEITLSGHAATREQVLLIESALKNDPLFSNVPSPLQNIIKPTEIDFSFTFRLKK